MGHSNVLSPSNQMHSLYLITCCLPLIFPLKFRFCHFKKWSSSNTFRFCFCSFVVKSHNHKFYPLPSFNPGLVYLKSCHTFSYFQALASSQLQFSCAKNKGKTWIFPYIAIRIFCRAFVWKSIDARNWKKKSEMFKLF